jgi:hypothetical protein
MSDTRSNAGLLRFWSLRPGGGGVTFWRGVARGADRAGMEVSLAVQRPDPRPLAPAVVRLLERMVAERPEAADAAGGDWGRVRAIRHWAWSQIACADRPLTLPLTAEGFLPMNPAQVFGLFELDGGGVWCGGAAAALNRLYQAAGYPVMLVTLHLPAAWGGVHQLSAVQIRHGGRAIWSLQDAYFNTCATDATGDPIDLAGAAEALRRDGEGVRWSPTHLPMDRKPAYFVAAELRGDSEPAAIAREHWAIDPADTTWRTLDDGRLRFEGVRRFRRYAPRLEPLRQALRRHGLPASEAYMMLFLDHRLADPATAERFLAQVAAQAGSGRSAA